MSQELIQAFPNAVMIPFNPLWLKKIEDAKKRADVDMIIVDTNIPDWAIVPPNWLLREKWIVDNSEPDILEIGCQRGHVFRNQGYAQLDRWFGFDIDVWKQNNFIQGDAHMPPFKSKSFNTVVLAEILEHVIDPVKVAVESMNLAKKKLIITVPNEYCYDSETEVLTRDGFKYFRDLTDMDEMATLTENGKLEYNKPTSRQHFLYKGIMIHFQSKYVDLLVTPEHNMYISKVRSEEYEFISAEKLSNIKCYSMKKDAEWEGVEEEKFVYGDRTIPMDDWLRFFGWYISEGSTSIYRKKGETYNHYYAINIAQLNKEHRIEIIETVKKIGLHPGETRKAIIIYDKQLCLYLKQFGKSHDKYIPKELKNLSKRQLSILFESMMKGDGHDDNGSGEGCCYVTCSDRLGDDVQEILLKLGISSKVCIGKNRFGTWNHISINKSCLTPRTQNGLNCHYENYDGEIYDVTVPNHTLFIRRNGIVVWSGNCWGPTALPFCDRYVKDKMDGITHRQQIDKNSRWIPDCLNPKEQIATWDEDNYEHLWHSRHFYHTDDTTQIPSGRTTDPEVNFIEYMNTVCKTFDETYNPEVKTQFQCHIEKIEYFPWAFLGAVICLDGEPFMSRFEFIKQLDVGDDWYSQVMSGPQNQLVGFLRRA